MEQLGRLMKYIGLVAVICLGLSMATAAWAQQSASFSDGGTTVGYDSRTCDASIEGTLRYNSASSCVEFCNGTGWTCPVSSCGAFPYNFVDQLDVAKNTIISSNIVIINTNACSAAPVTVSGDGSPQYRICNNSSCSSVDHDWATTGNSIDDNQYLQVRMTSSTTQSTMHTIVVSVGGALEVWNTTTAVDGYLAFVTSTTHNGGLGGLGHADHICRTRAAAAGYSGYFMAWLAESTGATAPATRFTQPTTLYQRVDGTTVANNWTDLVDGTLIAGINKDENNVTRSGFVWSGTTSAGVGRSSAYNCDSWNSSSGVDNGTTGTIGSITATWADDGITSGADCDIGRRFYCFQQISDPVGDHKKIFISSTTYRGNLGGLTGADNTCQSLASSAGLNGTYRAWLSDSSTTTEVVDRFTQATVPYRMVNGVRVANNWTDLVDGALKTGIVIDENGNYVSGGLAFTNTTTAGARAHSSYHCTNWTSTSGVEDSYAGVVGMAGNEWTTNGTLILADCSTFNRLICVEQ